MPKITITSVSGLVQKTGSGLEVNDTETISDLTNRTLSATKIISRLSASSGEVGVTLPTAGVTIGQTKFIIVDNVDNTVVLSGSNAHTVDTTFNAVGDGAICFFDGNLWSVLINNS